MAEGARRDRIAEDHDAFAWQPRVIVENLGKHGLGPVGQIDRLDEEGHYGTGGLTGYRRRVEAIASQRIPGQSGIVH